MGHGASRKQHFRGSGQKKVATTGAGAGWGSGLLLSFFVSDTVVLKITLSAGKHLDKYIYRTHGRYIPYTVYISRHWWVQSVRTNED